MKYDSEIHRRKSIRLKDYDYSLPGYYFVTICTEDRLQLFGEIENGKMILNDIGNLVFKMLYDLPNRFKTFEIDANILMPNHLHTIIIINDPQNVGVELALPNNSPQNVGVELALPKESLPINCSGKDRASSVPTLGRIIQVFKSISAIEINRFRGVSGIPVWQRNYYEHIIRNEKDFYEIRRYIEYNPINWIDDKYHI